MAHRWDSHCGQVFQRNQTLHVKPLSSPKEPFVHLYLFIRVEVTGSLGARVTSGSPRPTRPWLTCCFQFAHSPSWGSRTPHPSSTSQQKGCSQRAVGGLTQVGDACVTGRKGVSGCPRGSAPGRGRFLDATPFSLCAFCTFWGLARTVQTPLPLSESKSSVPRSCVISAAFRRYLSSRRLLKVLSSVSVAFLGVRPHGVCCCGAQHQRSAGLAWGRLVLLRAGVRISTRPPPLEPGTTSLICCFLPSLFTLPQGRSTGPEMSIIRSLLPLKAELPAPPSNPTPLSSVETSPACRGCG